MNSIYKLETAEELLKRNIKKPVFVIDKILPAGVTILSSRPKVGKSFLALQLSQYISKGESIFEKYKSHPQNCLFLSYEDSDARLQDRLSKMNYAPNLDSDSHKLFIKTNFSGLDSYGLVELQLIVKEYKIGFIVVDTLAKAVHFKETKGNAYFDEYRKMGVLQKFASENNVSMLFVHHNRKQESMYSVDSVLGTSGISGGCDNIWIMNKVNTRVKLDIYGKDIFESHLWLVFDNDNEHWGLIGEAPAATLTPERQEIYDLLKSADNPVRTGEIAAAVCKKTNNVSTLLKGMVNEGVVANPKTGYYTVAE